MCVFTYRIWTVLNSSGARSAGLPKEVRIQCLPEGVTEPPRPPQSQGLHSGSNQAGVWGAPGDASTDVPWYKKPFVWIIRKMNAAKASVMGAITNAITIF